MLSCQSRQFFRDLLEFIYLFFQSGMFIVISGLRPMVRHNSGVRERELESRERRAEGGTWYIVHGTESGLCAGPDGVLQTLSK